METGCRIKLRARVDGISRPGRIKRGPRLRGDRDPLARKTVYESRATGGLVHMKGTDGGAKGKEKYHRRGLFGGRQEEEKNDE